MCAEKAVLGSSAQNREAEHTVGLPPRKVVPYVFFGRVENDPAVERWGVQKWAIGKVFWPVEDVTRRE